jgi:hypothetical protein
MDFNTVGNLLKVKVTQEVSAARALHSYFYTDLENEDTET